MQKGYYYMGDTFDLPRLKATQEEVLSLLLARRLLSRSAGGVISEQIQRMTRKLFQSADGALEIKPADIDEAFSAAWHGHAPAEPQVFQRAANSLLNRRVLRFAYLSPGTNERTAREAEPHHLQHYMANWVLVAFCHNRGAWRKFYLSRMENLLSAPAGSGNSIGIRRRR